MGELSIPPHITAAMLLPVVIVVLATICTNHASPLHEEEIHRQGLALNVSSNADEDWVYWPKGTHDHRAKRRYADTGLEFVGFYGAGGDDNIYANLDTWEKCMRFGEDKRARSGEEWNGVVYNFESSICYCIKNIFQTQEYPQLLMFQFYYHPPPMMVTQSDQTV